MSIIRDIEDRNDPRNDVQIDVPPPPPLPSPQAPSPAGLPIPTPGDTDSGTGTLPVGLSRHEPVLPGSTDEFGITEPDVLPSMTPVDPENQPMDRLETTPPEYDAGTGTFSAPQLGTAGVTNEEDNPDVQMPGGIEQPDPTLQHVQGKFLNQITEERDRWNDWEHMFLSGDMQPTLYNSSEAELNKGTSDYYNTLGTNIKQMRQDLMNYGFNPPPQTETDPAKFRPDSTSNPFKNGTVAGTINRAAKEHQSKWGMTNEFAPLEGYRRVIDDVKKKGEWWKLPFILPLAGHFSQYGDAGDGLLGQLIYVAGLPDNLFYSGVVSLVNHATGNYKKHDTPAPLQALQGKSYDLTMQYDPVNRPISIVGKKGAPKTVTELINRSALYNNPAIRPLLERYRKENGDVIKDDLWNVLQMNDKWGHSLLQYGEFGLGILGALVTPGWGEDIRLISKGWSSFTGLFKKGTPNAAAATQAAKAVEGLVQRPSVPEQPTKIQTPPQKLNTSVEEGLAPARTAGQPPALPPRRVVNPPATPPRNVQIAKELVEGKVKFVNPPDLIEIPRTDEQLTQLAKALGDANPSRIAPLSRARLDELASDNPVKRSLYSRYGVPLKPENLVQPDAPPVINYIGPSRTTEQIFDQFQETVRQLEKATDDQQVNQLAHQADELADELFNPPKLTTDVPDAVDEWEIYDDMRKIEWNPGQGLFRKPKPEFDTEVETLQLLKGTPGVQQFESFGDGKLVTKNIEGLVLPKYIHQNPDKVDDVVNQIQKVMESVHAKGVTHGDSMNITNYIVDKNGKVHLIDFADSKKIGEEGTEIQLNFEKNKLPDRLRKALNEVKDIEEAPPANIFKSTVVPRKPQSKLDEVHKSLPTELKSKSPAGVELTQQKIDLDYEATSLKKTATAEYEHYLEMRRVLNEQAAKLDELPNVERNNLIKEIPFVPKGARTAPKLIVNPELAAKVSEGEWHHGTKVAGFDPNNIDPVLGGARAEFGPGMYLSRNVDTATDYARAMPQRNLPRLQGNRQFEEVGTVHRVAAKVENPIDLNLPPSNDVRNGVLRAIDNSFLSREVVKEFRGAIKNTDLPLKEYWRKLDDIAAKHYQDFPENLVLDTQRKINDNIRAAGYDALTDADDMLVVLSNPTGTKFTLNGAEKVGTGDLLEQAANRYNADVKAADRFPTPTATANREASKTALLTQMVRQQERNYKEVAEQAQLAAVNLAETDKRLRRLVRAERQQRIVEIEAEAVKSQDVQISHYKQPDGDWCY